MIITFSISADDGSEEFKATANNLEDFHMELGRLERHFLKQIVARDKLIAKNNQNEIT